jgi:hypothetical protein
LVWIERFSAGGIRESLGLANRIVQDLIRLNVENWFSPMDPDAVVLQAKANLLSWGAGALIAAISVWLIHRLSKGSDDISNHVDRFSRQAILIGLVGVLAGGITAWITGRQFNGSPIVDELILGPILGVVLFLVGIVHWFSRTRIKQSVLLGILFGFALSSQMQTVNKYRLSREQQQDYYWQLTWRAPSIKPGTAVIGPDLPFAMVNANSIGYALNRIYNPQPSTFDVPVWFFRAGDMTAEKGSAWKTGNPIDFSFSNVHFSGNTSQVLVADYAYGTGCLHIINAEDLLRLDLKKDQNALYKLSDPQLIDLHPTIPALPSQDIFGSEPAHEWCYLYQKMEGALQEKDWSSAANLADDAASKGYKPKTALEFTPVILSYVRSQQVEKAIQASLQGQQKDPDQTAYFCAFWKSELDRFPELVEAFGQAKNALQCDELRPSGNGG